MIKSKGIRILCYIAVGISYFASLCFLIAGINRLIDESFLAAIIYIILCAIIPLVTNLSLYPIFALSLIESNTASLNDKLDDMISLLEDMSMPRSSQNNSSESTKVAPTPMISPNPTQKDETPTFVSNDNQPEHVVQAIDFVNKKYNLHIDLRDDYFLIKEKISKIQATNKSVAIFKNRVIDATSYDDVISAINIHRVVAHKDNDNKNPEHYSYISR